MGCFEPWISRCSAQIQLGLYPLTRLIQTVDVRSDGQRYVPIRPGIHLILAVERRSGGQKQRIPPLAACFVKESLCLYELEPAVLLNYALCLRKLTPRALIYLVIEAQSKALENQRK
jgi:hypothetical protein